MSPPRSQPPHSGRLSPEEIQRYEEELLREKLREYANEEYVYQEKDEDYIDPSNVNEDIFDPRDEI
jgi:hypothetical protein